MHTLISILRCVAVFSAAYLTFVFLTSLGKTLTNCIVKTIAWASSDKKDKEKFEFVDKTTPALAVSAAVLWAIVALLYS